MQKGYHLACCVAAHRYLKILEYARGVYMVNIRTQMAKGRVPGTKVEAAKQVYRGGVTYLMQTFFFNLVFKIL